jgi:hypothetical protein
MAKRKRKTAEVLEVEPEELMFAFNVADAAASLRMPVENPGTKSIKLLDEKKGKVRTIALTDRPMNRAMLAVGEHFKGDKFKALMWRLLAMHDILEDPRLASWVRQASDGRTEIAESLLAAAARARMTTKKNTFDIDEIAKLAAAWDKDEDLVDPPK